MKIIKNSCDGAYTSLDVRFTKVCDNDCSFCIEKTGIDSLGKPNVPTLIESTIKSQIRNVLVLGGEPFLYPNELYEYVSGIREHVDEIYITSSLPISFLKKKELCDDIINKIDGLNISIQNVDWVKNNEILRASSKTDRLSILQMLNISHSDKIRTSINLVKGGIDNREELMKTLKYLQGIGCKYVKINELQGSDLYVSYEDIMCVKMKSPYAFGCNKHITIDGVDMKLLLKRSCFITEDTKSASIMDVIKILISKFIYTKLFKSKTIFRVLYENGSIKNKWLKK